MSAVAVIWQKYCWKWLKTPITQSFRTKDENIFLVKEKIPVASILSFFFRSMLYSISQINLVIWNISNVTHAFFFFFFKTWTGLKFCCLATMLYCMDRGEDYIENTCSLSTVICPERYRSPWSGFLWFSNLITCSEANWMRETRLGHCSLRRLLKVNTTGLHPLCPKNLWKR